MIDSSLPPELTVFDRSLRQQFVLWAVRWAIGFAVIALVVRLRPGLAWLWWAGAAVAVLSALTLLVIYLVVHRRLAAAQARIARYEQLAREAEEVLGRDESRS